MSNLLDDQSARGKWAHEITISQLTVVEVAAAMEKRRRMKDISERHRVRTLSKFSIETRQRYTLIQISDPIVELAVELTGRHPLRAYDAVQLASALRLDQVMQDNDLPSPTFVSADELLCQAADGEGIATADPNKLDEEER